MPTERPRIQDIVRVSGLSAATVDRVLNNRPGTSARAIERVGAAALKLSLGTGDPVPSSDGIFDVILPREAGLSTEYLAAAFRYHAARHGVRLRVHYVERLNPGELALNLENCARNGSNGIAFQALEDPVVREAVTRISAQRIPLMTVVSGLAGLGLGYVGLDNRAAGRTAGYFMGHLCRSAGAVAVIWGGHLYRGHDEREIGFRSILRTEFPDMEIVDVTCTQDNADEAYARLSDVLKGRGSLAGVYCVGAGIVGAVRALREQHAERKCAIVCHNLTANTREFLLNREVEVIIHQDMPQIADLAINSLMTYDPKIRRSPFEIPIQVITRENMGHQLNVESIKAFLTA